MNRLRWAVTLAAALVISALVVAGPAPEARACMPGFWHPRQDVIVLWHEGVQVLIWRTLVAPAQPPPGARVDPNARPANGAPVAWLLAVPSTPIAYEIEELEPFERTLDWAAAHEAPEPPGGGGGGPRGHGDGLGGITVHATQTVGDYEVTPITGTGEAASTALAQWLRQNHFPAANDQAVRTYVAQNATFLAVKARYPGGDAAKLRPLAIAFRSDAIVIPLKLSASEAPYSLGVTIFSTRRPEPQHLTQGMMVRRVRQPGVLPGQAQEHDAALVPHVSIPAAMRSLATRISGRVPELRRMEGGSLWFMRLAGTPVQANAAANVPDPTLRLGEAATASNGTPAPSPTPTPTPAPAPVEQQPGPAAATSTDDDCSVGGDPRGAFAGAAVLAVALLALARRRRA